MSSVATGRTEREGGGRDDDGPLAAAAAAVVLAQQAPVAVDAGVVAAASIALTSEPPGADVYQEGALLGNTPLTLAKPAGEAQLALEVRAAGFGSQTILVSALSPPTLSVTLAPAVVAHAPRDPGPREHTTPPPPPPPHHTKNVPVGVASELADPWNP